MIRAPAAGGRGVGILTWHQIGPAGIPDALATARPNRKWYAGVQGHDAVHLPVARDSVQRLVHVGAVLLTPAEGQFVNEAANEVVPNVPGGVGVPAGVVSRIGYPKASGAAKGRSSICQGVA